MAGVAPADAVAAGVVRLVGDGTRLAAGRRPTASRLGDGDLDNDLDGDGPVELDAGGDDELVDDRVGEPLVVPLFVPLVVALLDPGDPADGLGDEPLPERADGVACGCVGLPGAGPSDGCGWAGTGSMWKGVTVLTIFEMSRCADAGRLWVAAPATSSAIDRCRGGERR